MLFIFDKSTILLNEGPTTLLKGADNEYSQLLRVVLEPWLTKGPTLKLKKRSRRGDAFPIEWLCVRV